MISREIEVFDTDKLSDLLESIHAETRRGIIKTHEDTRRYERDTYDKWRELYKKCNPIDYLINSSASSIKTKCLRDCYDNMNKFLIFITDTHRKLLGMFGVYESYVARARSDECDASILRRLGIIESQIIKNVSKLQTYIESFDKLGILYVSPLRFYRLFEFIKVFTGQPLELPTLKIDDTMKSLTIYLRTNKKIVTVTGYCVTRNDKRLTTEPMNDTEVQETPRRDYKLPPPSSSSPPPPPSLPPPPLVDRGYFCRNSVCRQSARSAKSEISSLINLGDTSDFQFESMSIGDSSRIRSDIDDTDSWFEDELIVSSEDIPNDLMLLNNDDIEEIVAVDASITDSLYDRLYANYDGDQEMLPSKREAMDYGEIVYAKLNTQSTLEIEHDDEIRKYITHIRKYLRSLYNESMNTTRDDPHGLQIALPEHLRKVFRAVSVCGDGSCFYSALSVQMISDSSLARLLRILVVYHMIINKWWILNNFYVNLNGDMTFNDLVKQSLSSREYIDGGYPPVMMSIILNRPINIYGHSKNTFIRINSWVFQSLETHRADQLSEFYVYLDESHYTALALLKNDTSNIPHLDDYKADVFSTFTLV